MIEEFYHSDVFVTDQTRQFVSLLGEARPLVVVDVGGGCGFFARALADRTDHQVRVVDMDPASVEACRRNGVEAAQGDALAPPAAGDEDVVCLNLILHHLVAGSERRTAELQRQALAVWRPHVRAVFVNEYIYTSFVGGLAGWLIYRITRSRTLSWIARQIARAVPSLRANTFGVGVRFRSHPEWVRLFGEAGYTVARFEESEPEPISAARRLLFIKQMHRCSYWLEPRAA